MEACARAAAAVHMYTCRYIIGSAYVYVQIYYRHMYTCGYILWAVHMYTCRYIMGICIRAILWAVHMYMCRYIIGICIRADIYIFLMLLRLAYQLLLDST